MHRVNQSLGVRVACIVGVLFLAGTACSSSSKSSAGSQGTAPGGASTTSAGNQGAALGGTQPTGAPFKIGYIEDAISLGAGGSNRYTIPVFDAWVKWTNAHGGINGHPVQLIAKREPNNPGVALTDVQQLIGQGIVALVADDVTDSQAWLATADKAGIPVFEGASETLADAGDANVFTTLPSLLITPQQVVESAAKVGAKRMAVFYCAEIPACGQAVPAFAAVGKAAGVSIAFSTSILGSAPDFTAQCLAGKEHGADSAFVADASQIILRVAASCAQQGFTPHEIVNTTNVQANFAGAPGMDGMIGFDGVAPFFDTSFPGVQTMLSALDQYDPGLTKDPQFGDLSTTGWTAGLLIAEAAKAGGVGAANPLSAAAMLDGIYTLHSTNLGGMTPTLTFERGGPHVNRCWFWMAIQNGKFTLPDGLTPQCQPQ